MTLISLGSCQKETAEEALPFQRTQQNLEGKVAAYLAGNSDLQPSSQARVSSFEQVYLTHQIQFFQRLNSIAKGLIDPAKSPVLQNLVALECDRMYCESDLKVPTLDLVRVYDSLGGDLMTEVGSSAQRYGTMQDYQFATSHFQTLTVAGVDYHPVIAMPHLDEDVQEIGGITPPPAPAPEYITTSSSKISETEYLAYRVSDGLGFVLDADYAASHVGWFVSLKEYDGKGGGPLPLGPIAKSRCQATGTNEPWGCYTTNSGILCRVKIFGFITISGPPNMCTPAIN